MRVLALCPADPATLGDIIRLAAKANLIRSVDGSLRGVSSGFNSYVSFRSLLGRPFLPPLEGAIILRVSCFRPGLTSRNYLGHRKKAFLVYACSLEWYNTAVREIPRSPRHAQKHSFRFPNFTYTQDPYTVANHLGWEDEFPPVIFLPCLLSLRIASDSLPIRTANIKERQGKFTPQSDDVLIGVRPFS